MLRKLQKTKRNETRYKYLNDLKITLDFFQIKKKTCRALQQQQQQQRKKTFGPNFLSFG